VHGKDQIGLKSKATARSNISHALGSEDLSVYSVDAKGMRLTPTQRARHTTCWAESSHEKTVHILQPENLTDIKLSANGTGGGGTVCLCPTRVLDMAIGEAKSIGRSH
jgi:hypothetical protein